MSKTLAVLALLFIFFLFIHRSEEMQRIEEIEKTLTKDVYVFQYHKKDIKDFSFLRKHKHLRAIDLSFSSVQDISFIQDIEDLEVLILKGTDFDYDDVSEFRGISDRSEDHDGRRFFLESHLNYTEGEFISYDHGKGGTRYDPYPDLFFFNDHKMYQAQLIEAFRLMEESDQPSEDLIPEPFSSNKNWRKRSLTLNLWVNDSFQFSDLTGLLLFENLETLYIHLRDDKHINQLTELKYLTELHLIGNIKKYPKAFQPSLKKLYLYDLMLEDFSFLKDSNIEELHLIGVKHRYQLEKFEKMYPKVKFIKKGKLFLPYYYKKLNWMQRKYDLVIDGLKYHSIDIKNHFLKADPHIIQELRHGKLEFELNILNAQNLVEVLEINKNYLWNENETLLDIALAQGDELLVEFLVKRTSWVYESGPLKRGCEILEKPCKPLSEDFENLLKKRKKEDQIGSCTGGYIR